MAQQLLGLPVAKALTEALQSRTEKLVVKGVTPTLAIVRVGSREDDLAYERAALKRCEQVNVAATTIVLPNDCTQRELLDAIERVNSDDTIHGCLLFRPLPSSLDEEAACNALDPSKDVDGITTSSLYGVFANRPVGFSPCTAEAVVRLLEFYGYALEGANVVVVGRSLVIGKPVSMLLQARNATVTMCHTRTRDLAAVCRAADVLVVAAGHAKTIGADAVSSEQVVVDVGINWDEAAGKLCGDVAYDEVEPLVKAITPVPRGVGSITTAVLVQHVVNAAERSVQHGAAVV